ncbi:MAG TPA: tRNA pseudouridine(13) synthase TruD [Anaeromyxobacteraceae bacterium]|nr:tRNA pseudouridine(13) synthase TruD [Anaeromyxobacteraceae bacterium]
MKLKQRPEDFVVTESWRFDEDPSGEHYVYLMDKQKLTTFDAVDRICERFKVHHAAVSYCGLKDKQGRTTQLVAIRGQPVELQDPDLRLKYLGRSASPLTAANTTSNRFAVTVRDLGEEDLAKLTGSVAEVHRLGVVNYFDSQRFGALKHGQGFVAKEFLRGDFEVALKNLVARPSELDQTDDARVKGFWKEHWGEWEKRNPFPGAEKYRRIIKYLAGHPGDFRGAILRTEPRWRALQVFAYQSWLWNEGAKAYLKDVVGITRLVPVRYQVGVLLFPRELDSATADLLHGRTFPLLAPDSTFDDERVKRAAMSVMKRDDMTLASLRVPNTPEIHFDHEERPLIVHPGRLTVGAPQRDELNPGRFRVNVAFTLPPGAYATLVVKRLFHWTLEPRNASPRARREAEQAAREERLTRRESGVSAARKAPLLGPASGAPARPAAGAPAAPEAPAAPIGFRAKQKAKKAAREEARVAAAARKVAKRKPAKRGR